MGTQFQRLKIPRAWGPEAVEADSAWNLEAHHVVFLARLHLPERILEVSSTRGRLKFVDVAAKDGSWPAPSLVPPTQPFRETTSLCVLGAGSLKGPNPNPNRTPNRDPPPKVKPASIPNPAIEHPPRPGLSLTMAHHG